MPTSASPSFPLILKDTVALDVSNVHFFRLTITLDRWKPKFPHRQWPIAGEPEHPGGSPVCSGPSYSTHLENWLPDIRRRYRPNLDLSCEPKFIYRLCAFFTTRPVELVRLHVGGDFYSAHYARRWLNIMRRLPRTRFYLYSRSRRVPAIRRVLRLMAQSEHSQVWFSCDRDTGVSTRLPRRVRLAWLMTGPEHLPPDAQLVFRTHKFRSVVQ